mgnify:CR=1 FL=1
MSEGITKGIVKETRERYLQIGEAYYDCPLYTSDAADDLRCVDLGGRRFIKKKNKSANLENTFNLHSIHTQTPPAHIYRTITQRTLNHHTPHSPSTPPV